MHAPRRFKQAFLEQLLLSLQVAGLTSKAMGLRERKNAVKLSSDVAMASARGGAAWASALVARHAAERRNEALMRRIMGSGRFERAAMAAGREEAAGACKKVMRSRRIVTRSHRVCSKRKRSRYLHASAMARRMVKGRLQVLRGLCQEGRGCMASPC